MRPINNKSYMSKSPITYRYGRVEDAEAISELGARVFTSSFASLLPPNDLASYLSEAYSTKNIAADLTNPSVTFVVAAVDTTLVAFLQLRRDTSAQCIDQMESKIQLQRLYVSEKCQGLGIGKHLLARAEREARDMGAKNIWLASWKPNHKAERIYESTGYVKSGEIAFALGGSKLEDWVMVKSI